jgi:membrane protein
MVMVSTRRVLTRALSEFCADDALNLGAALAFYTALALAPLLLIVIRIAGLLDPGAQQHLIAQVGGFIGAQAGEAVEELIAAAEHSQSNGRLATLLGTATLLLSATGVFGQLQTSLNRIWGVRSRPEASWGWAWLRKRLLSFGMVLSVAFLLLVSLLISAVLAALLSPETLLWNALNLAVSIGLFTALFALMFRYLPDVRIAWRDVWSGALLTALLFAVGKFAIGLYLGRSSVSSAYGAAGSFVVLLLWVYYSSLVFFLGAELTEAYSHEQRGPLAPEPTAERVPS